MNYEGALRLLEERQDVRWKTGLTRSSALLRGLGDPQDAVPCVHVAGTNGKGTVCALLANILGAAGLRVGLNTSPHLADPRERMLVGGRRISREDFGRMVGRARDAEEDEASWFELLTGAAFLHFRERKADIAVVEVGLGGRLDATNVIRAPLLTVITSISFDHTQQLGHTLAAIAAEKAGIVKPGVPCISGEDAPEALGAIRARCAEVGAPLITSRPVLRTVAERWEDGSQELECEDGRRLRLRLMGAAAATNASIVLAAVSELRTRGLAIPDAAVARGFAELDWPCRFQVARESSRTVVLDGAHNVAAMESFTETWRRSPWSRQDPLFVLGMLKDKDAGAMARLLASQVRRAIVTQPPSPRALPAAELAGLLRDAGCAEVSVEPDPEAAWKAWKRSGAGVGVVCGSFYLAGQIWSRLRGVPNGRARLRAAA
ncbi:MAG: hypothetical protein A2X36_03240 [Elusimicrobia bacterium GWA2_69_24]|nr:MAG: hypothetical protein A2X36_03240 [Elusimicrobia bacterium GWA2_69_24]HBL15249.1 bifunctional folylpolyglutamate synthase/dihydrofolate synthase [Elusimicrobiota bacterium]